MKNIFKLFFIVCLFFVSACANAFDTQKNTDYIKAVQTQNIFTAGNSQETSVVSSNSQSSEIYLQNDNKENYTGGNLFKASSQAKFLQEIFAQNYNKSFLSKSQKISPILRNEICTRAP